MAPETVVGNKNIIPNHSPEFFLFHPSSCIEHSTAGTVGTTMPQPNPTVLPLVTVNVCSPIGIGWDGGRLGRTSDRRSTVKQLLFSFSSVFGHLFFFFIRLLASFLLHPSSGI